jgi:polyphosphate kinase
MNSLEDIPIIERLYEASQAGVPITLIVRGFCCLRPGVAGLSDNITVVSIVGRFLEHSRIYHFAAGHADPLAGDWLIGSADWMSRNLNDRVELITPVDDPKARQTLHHIFEVCLADRARAWFLQPDGTYRQLPPDADADPEGPAYLGTFEVMCREALASRSARS